MGGGAVVGGLGSKTKAQVFTDLVLRGRREFSRLITEKSELQPSIPVFKLLLEFITRG